MEPVVVAPDGPGRLGRGVGDEDGLGLGVAELVGDLPLLVEGVQGGDGGPGEEGAVEGDDPLGGVRGHDGDPVPRLDALVLQGAGHPPGCVPESGEGVLRLTDPVDDGDALGPGLGRPRE